MLLLNKYEYSYLLTYLVTYLLTYCTLKCMMIDRGQASEGSAAIWDRVIE